MLRASHIALRTQESVKRSRFVDAARDVADGKITLEELMTKALHDAVITERNIRLAGQGAFYNPPEQPTTIELNMELFNRSARAIAIRRERTAALMRAAKPLPTSDINPDVSISSVGGFESFIPYCRATVARPHTSICSYDSEPCHRAAGKCTDHCGSIYFAPVIC